MLFWRGIQTLYIYLLNLTQHQLWAKEWNTSDRFTAVIKPLYNQRRQQLTTYKMFMEISGRDGWSHGDRWILNAAGIWSLHTRRTFFVMRAVLGRKGGFYSRNVSIMLLQKSTNYNYLANCRSLLLSITFMNNWNSGQLKYFAKRKSFRTWQRKIHRNTWLFQTMSASNEVNHCKIQFIAMCKGHNIDSSRRKTKLTSFKLVLRTIKWHVKKPQTSDLSAFQISLLRP